MTYLVGPMAGKRDPGTLANIELQKRGVKGRLLLFLFSFDFCKVITERSTYRLKIIKTPLVGIVD